jgi:hypothetical protein
MCWKSKSPAWRPGFSFQQAPRRIHSYTTPLIPALPVEWVDTDYTAWIMAETKAREIDTTGWSELTTHNRLVGSSERIGSEERGCFVKLGHG